MSKPRFTMIEREIFHVLAGDKAYSPASFDNNESTMNEILINTPVNIQAKANDSFDSTKG